MIDKNRFPMDYLPKPAFENAEYQLRITHTVSTDKRIMSFTDTLWGFEVTGGYDQYESLTVINVRICASCFFVFEAIYLDVLTGQSQWLRAEGWYSGK